MTRAKRMGGTTVEDMVVVSTRLERQYSEALRRVARLRGITISQLLRDFAANAESAYSFLEQEQLRQQTSNPKFDGNMARWILANTPKDTPPEMLDFLGVALRHAAEMLLEQAKEAGEETPV